MSELSSLMTVSNGQGEAQTVSRLYDATVRAGKAVWRWLSEVPPSPEADTASPEEQEAAIQRALATTFTQMH